MPPGILQNATKKKKNGGKKKLAVYESSMTFPVFRMLPLAGLLAGKNKRTEAKMKERGAN